ncbi:hypothetical protein L1987_63948 [Smallanthus sonchifolius]|uniref:Uncharacterized protein n=1 Tax=Smallanthus sonchifolius TaxID=185202 RepID=A0ACB9CEY8_9ASTR|nr:hypothetical protein L1987_63948 [Smallanthus sonchifolius]
MARRVEYKHNQVALLDPNMSEVVNFQGIINVLNRSRLHVALSVDPYFILPYIQQLWDIVHQDTNVEPHVFRATVNNTEVAISVDTIRDVLALGGANEDPISYPRTLIMGCFQKMGYRGRPNDTQARKDLPQHPIYLTLTPMSKRIFTDCTKPSNDIRFHPEGLVQGQVQNQVQQPQQVSIQQQQFPIQQPKVHIPQEQVHIPVNEPVQEDIAQDNEQDLGMNMDDFDNDAVNSPIHEAEGNVVDTSSGDTILLDSKATDSDSSRDFSSDHYERLATLPLANVGKHIKSKARKPRRKSVWNPASGSVLGKRTLIDESSDSDSDVIPVPKAQKLMSASIDSKATATFVASLLVTPPTSKHPSPMISPHVPHSSDAGPSKPHDSERITFLESQVLALQTVRT